ncbi:alpha-beta hydrolase superfamily lysophospholipase [Agromyces terreus]|uniref:Alpha-beta hydrolase superfamily lysophospholipase n=1 Tax=Agromyces terreus TaxID=424795 RepID=A0A9X2KBF5_9MICO|nr:alpha/beta fold hydrolase [Agromyces terreus]MCP2370105.1 alpha-beta hydrolase superfamily lysophospholipase [Agromyces terreus]
MPTFTDAHGVHIHYRSWRVPVPKAAVQLAHGVGEHIGRYAELIEALNGAGYSVWADDHRGHGQTGFEQHGGDLDRLGRLGPGGLRATIAAVEQFTEVIREAEGDLPLILLGHSWGSLMAQIIVNRRARDYDAVVLTGTAYRTPFDMNGGDLNARHKHLGPTPVEWLSRDPEVPPAFMADPYTTAVPLRKLFGTRDAMRLLGRPAKHLPAELPMLIMVGDDDPLGGEASAVKLANAYARRSGLADVTLVVYPEARHEVFNETNRDEVRADLITWLDERFADD